MDELKDEFWLLYMASLRGSTFLTAWTVIIQEYLDSSEATAK